MDAQMSSTEAISMQQELRWIGHVPPQYLCLIQDCPSKFSIHNWIIV